MREGGDRLPWRKSTQCGTGACVEVTSKDDFFLMRDSKDPDGPVLVFSTMAWREFVADIRAGLFDPPRPE